ncbi:MAG TPA: dihydroorotate dehydrogenase-like protein [Acidimicrobiales bacterium]|nr:dihydroorotate dehydrogenase-like protein [Acidimicrobiales bacterium]
MATLDLSTRYLGLRLRSPLVASAGPLTGDAATARQLAEAGAGAIVLPSLFEEEIVGEETGLAAALEAGAEHQHEASSYFPAMPSVPSVAERYVANLERVKAAVDVPVIASLNASSPGGWIRYAGLLADAGADAIELNVYRVAADPSSSGAEVEGSELDLIAAVCAAAAVPVAVKLSPYYSAMANFAAAAVSAGAAGLVLFNRFYQPDIDLDSMEVRPRIELSSRYELGLPLRWIAILRGQLPADTSLAATSGVQRGEDAAKALAAGADVVMTTSELLRSGPGRLGAITDELESWLAGHEYLSVSELRGSVSQLAAGDGEAFARANYLRTLRSWSASQGARR